MKTGRVLVAVALAGCSSSVNSSTQTGDQEANAQRCSCPADAGTGGGGRHYHYVLSSVTLGTDTTGARALGFDLDSDGRPDNNLGIALIGLDQGGVSVRSAMDQAIASGAVVMLASLRASDLVADRMASWQGFAGDPQPSPDLSGGGSFTVSAESPLDAIVPGAIESARFTGTSGVALAPIVLDRGLPPLQLRMRGAHAEATCTATGCTGGRAGGAIRKADIDGKILPLLANALEARLEADGCDQSPVPATCTSADEQILSLFDSNGDRQISVAEVAGNAVVQSIFAPDLDLDHDGIKESLSYAYGFTAARAAFTATE